MKAPKNEIVAKFKSAQNRLVLQAADLSLDTISGMVASKAIDISPTYQRRERWSSKQQSALIESFLLNIPVPPIYLSEEDFGVYSAIDGKQRIIAITEFMSDRLRLQGLETFTQIEGASIADLPIELQNALRVRPYIRAITLLKQSAHDLKYEVFTRLNRQGIPLNAQEIRNVVFRGELNDLIYRIAFNNKFLRKQLKIKDDRSSAFTDMDDAEYVLRFLMLHEDMSEFEESFRRSMDNFMAKRTDVGSAEFKRLESIFNNAIQSCEAIWGDYAFKRAAGDIWRDQFLGGMYDAQMLGVSAVEPRVVKRAIEKRLDVIAGTKALFKEDENFERAVREGTNTRARVQYRIEMIAQLLRSI